MMKKLLLSAMLAILFSNLSDAQTWQWGKRGGSADNGGSSSDRETVNDMATDPKGNIYVLAYAGKSSLNFDGNNKTGFSRRDLYVVSVSCNGTYRWSKAIGSFDDDNGLAIKTDASGGVYILGKVYSSNSFGYAKFDTDTTLGYNEKRIALVKYDTAGNYKWLRQPEADTVTAVGSNNFPLDLAVDANGTCHVYCYLTPGAYAKGGYVNTTTGAHILKYNSTGIYTGHVGLSITGGDVTSYANLRMIHSAGGDKYYFTGTSTNIVAPSLTIGGTAYPFPFIVAFSNSGTLLWGRKGTGLWNIYGRPAIDASGRLFISSAAQSGAAFNGFSATTANVGAGGPVVSAMDSNGTMLWNTAARTNGSAGGQAIATSGTDVAIAGDYSGKVRWAGANDSLNLPANYGGNVLFARLNASTGAYIKQDSIYSPSGYFERATSICVDRNGNYYVGGYFESQIKVAGLTMNSIGGETDFFVAKNGVSNCSCIIPVSGFNANINTATKVGTFTYTGTTPVDSVRWTFGDGTTSNQMNPTHTFPSGTYNVCVTAYNSCGSNQYCNSVALAVPGFAALGNIKVYPNPAANYFAIDGAQGASATITNSIGQRAMQFGITTDKQVIDISALPAGMYLLQLTDAKGNRGTTSIVKQ